MKEFESFCGQGSFPGAMLHLEKHLPVAAGLGGGSADAGAAIRLLNRYWRAGIDPHDLRISAAALGADVPACVVSRTRVGTGSGADLAMPGPDDSVGLPVLLVNPGTPLATASVFGAWDGIDLGPLPGGSVIGSALAGRNDLEAPAIALCPVIAEILALLREQPGTTLVRMSGSGATCFALFADSAARDLADAAVARAAPAWWRLRSRLR